MKVKLLIILCHKAPPLFSFLLLFRKVVISCLLIDSQMGYHELQCTNFNMVQTTDTVHVYY